MNLARFPAAFAPPYGTPRGSVTLPLGPMMKYSAPVSQLPHCIIGVMKSPARYRLMDITMKSIAMCSSRVL